MKSRPFVNLLTRSGYMAGEVVGSPDEIILNSIAAGHTAAAISDTHNLAGVLELYYSGRNPALLEKAGLQRNHFPTLLGVTLNVTDDLSMRDSDNLSSNIIVYAKDQTGYSNACFLSSLGFEPESHFFEIPRISIEELIQNKEGLIVLDGGLTGYVSKMIEKGQMTEARAHIEMMKVAFGEDYYLVFDTMDNRRKWFKDLKKVVDTGVNDLVSINSSILTISYEMGVKAVVGITTNMLQAADSEMLSLMVKNIKKIPNYEPSELRYLMKSEEMFDRVLEKFPFAGEEDIINMMSAAIEVQGKCENIELIFTPEIPRMDYKKHPFWADKEAQATVAEWAVKFDADPKYKGFKTIFDKDDAVKLVLLCSLRYGRFDATNPAHVDRLLGELRDSQYNGRVRLLDYFFFIENAYRFATERGITTGLGRGSAAGSFLSNCLHITSVDPLKWDLLWSRFYTPDRAGVVKFKVSEKSAEVK